MMARLRLGETVTPRAAQTGPAQILPFSPRCRHSCAQGCAWFVACRLSGGPIGPGL